jgi:PAS domain S-box-containing protein
MSLPAAVPLGEFATLFNFLPIGAYRSSPDGQMIRSNQALVELNGYATEAEHLAAVKDIAREWYVDPLRRGAFKQQLEREGFVRGFVSEIWRHKTRERIWISENAHVVRNAQGEVLYYEGTVEDVTERIRNQEALRRSEEQLRQITAQVPGMVFVVHVAPDGRREYRFVSSGVRDIYGFDPEDLMRDPMLIARYRHPDDQAVLEQDLQQIRQGPVDLGGEFRVVMPDGQIRWVYRRSCTVSSDASGFLRVGVLLDITGRKQAEAALHESEALWRLAMDSTGDGVWDWNLATGGEFFSGRILAMFGFDEGELANLAEALDSRTHPDDVAQMLTDRQAHFDGHTPVYRNEHRVQRRILEMGALARHGDCPRQRRATAAHGGDPHRHHRAETGRSPAACAGNPAARVSKNGGHWYLGGRCGARFQQPAGRYFGQPGAGP